MIDRSVFYKEVGDRVRAQRGKRLSQESLASAVGLTRTSISNIEKGRQKLLLHTLVDIAEALDVEPSMLLPPRLAPVQPVGAEQLAGLPANERAFIESAIGLRAQERDTHGRQEKENSGNGANASARGAGKRSTRTGVGNRKGKGSPHLS